jgi:outer membrane protein assembly factor BamB
MNRLFSRAALLALVLTTLVFAQMGGGMGSGNGGGMMGPGNPGTPGTTGMNPGQGMGSGMGMSGAMGSREMMDGPTVGPDGTVYVVRLASAATTNQGMMSPSTSASKYELVAISASNGLTKWKVEITGTMVSEPALGKDGKIFMTASDFVMSGQSQSGGGMMNPGTSTTTARKSRLIIVTAYPASASISNTIELDSDVLSAPKVTDDAANYTVYVTGFEMGANDMDAVASGQKTLYAFTPVGNLKFSVKINQP